MVRKKTPPAIGAKKPQEQEAPPVITPEIEDGYNGVVRRLYCSICHQAFYVAEVIFKTLSSHTCHNCSAKAFQEYEEKRRRELAEQERQRLDEARRKAIDEILGFTYVRSLAEETRVKNAWNYGYTMLYCVELPFEEGRMWRVRAYKDDKHSGFSTHFLFLIWEIKKNAHMYLPIGSRHIYRVVNPMQMLSEEDPELFQLKALSEKDPDLFERKFLEKIYPELFKAKD